MERDLDDKADGLPEKQLEEMEERRIQSMDEAGINEIDVLNHANEHLNIWNSYFNENITRGKDDMNFALRDQWTAVERSEFTRLFKPAMTFNKIYDAVKKIVGEQRKNKPDLMVRSLTGKASQQDIELRSDLIRTISYQSQNDLVYQSAFQSALLMGFGAFQICLDYESPKSFNRVIRYELIPDSTRCFFDATALKPHKGDGNYCARLYVFTRDEFFATYPYITNPVSYPDPYMLLDFQWTTRDTITVCDYFVKEWYPLNIYKLSNGKSVTEDEWQDMQKSYKEQLKIVAGSEVESVIKNEMPHIVNERQTQDYRIMHYRMLRNQIIDWSEWPSKELPIIFVDGDSHFIEGRQYTRSFIHEARDAQKLLNYSRSETAAELKNRRREQWIGTPDNIIGYEQEWRNPEVQMGMLRAKPDPKTGQMPQKMPAWDISQGLFATSAAAGQDIREIMGFSETEELQGRDISGKARRERKLEGSMSAYVYRDNLNQAIAQSGRVVMGLLPHIAGEDERHMVLSKRDGKTKSVILNQRMKDGSIQNKIEAGDYDVEIDAGPSFSVQKDVSLEFFQQMIAADPETFKLVADLWADNMDITQRDQVKERLSNLVPPEILAKEKGEPRPPPKPPSPQEQMMQAEMQAKQAEIQNKQKDIEIKQQKLQLEAEQNQLDKAKMLLEAQKIQSANQLDLLDHQLNLKKAEVTHNLDHKKAEMGFSGDIARILADIHKQEAQHVHEKDFAKIQSSKSSE